MKVEYRKDLHKLIDLSLPTAEVGVAEGLFSKEILEWGSKEHYMVDLWEHVDNGEGMLKEPDDVHDSNLQNTLRITESFKKYRRILRGYSHEMAQQVKDDYLGFVFIDACHSYHCVLTDLELWVPKVKVGGIVAGHDFLNPDYGVNEAVKVFCRENNYTWNVIPDVGIEYASFWFRKTH